MQKKNEEITEKNREKGVLGRKFIGTLTFSNRTAVEACHIYNMHIWIEEVRHLVKKIKLNKIWVWEKNSFFENFKE